MGNRAICNGALCGDQDTVQRSSEREGFDPASPCDPAGTVFHETLGDLNEVDRLLLKFSSSSNVVAVRWLFVLGATVDMCDTNGTTCLHAACRSGSLSVVQELTRRGVPLGSTDIAGWTPLHVAFFMGRRGVAKHLMQGGADLARQTAKGFTPADLCSDVWLRDAIGSCIAHRNRHGLTRVWEYGSDAEVDEDGQVVPDLQLAPFFIPRKPLFESLANTGSLQELGTEIFNQRPGQGLAFLVAVGCVRDFPLELTKFLEKGSISPAQVGVFLGEDFSLSNTLRFEFINSVSLFGTGVVSCLKKVFTKFLMPSDMQKIDRLVSGIAQIWWRQHESLKESDRQVDGEDPDEIEGVDLMEHIAGHGVLHQLMFSAVMLHWNLYTPLPPSQRVTPMQWLDMNADLRCVAPDQDARSGMKNIQLLIYKTVNRSFIPQLQIWPKRGADTPSVVEIPASPGHKLVAASEEVGAWGTLVDGGFPSLAGAGGTCTYQHLRSLLSEINSATTDLATPVTSWSNHGGGKEPGREAASEQRAASPVATACKRSGFVQARKVHDDELGSELACPGKALADAGDQNTTWLTLRQSMLFLATKPQNWAPYAFIHLGKAVSHCVDKEALTLTLTPISETKTKERRQLQMVFLLPDACWRVLGMPRLKVQFPNKSSVERWMQGLEACCSLAAQLDSEDDSDDGEAYKEHDI
eukprot:CAMPEP_0179355526 /NCGR_PEP_ID=MMETSP0797-20121207/77419_1 /TAXON_ID=47934 /ORGANISM="Dinophysis acuminata, Strain DAEP01" /LENGTH=693 /DNA_ID=CAMNT_0021070677 /DNA_START=67 /DNA_END=2148 /DNA_ORIENTATION=+